VSFLNKEHKMYQIELYEDKNGYSEVYEYINELNKNNNKDSRIKLKKINMVAFKVVSDLFDLIVNYLILFDTIIITIYKFQL